MRLAVVTCLIMTLAAAPLWLRGAAQAPGLSVPAEIVYTSAPAYDPTAWLTGNDRFPGGGSVRVLRGTETRALVPGFAASADPSVSFDAKRILFAGRREATSPWQIWEVAVTGGEPRQLTHCSEDCVRPFYLPGDRLVYAQKLNGHFVLATAPLTGGPSLQLTYAPGNALPSDVLRDGRILFEASYPLGEGAGPELYTVYSDGSGVESYRCDHGDARYAGKQIPSGDIVFAKQHGLARFTSALAHEAELNTPAGDFDGGVADNNSSYVVSWRPDAKTPYSLQVWNSQAGTLSPLPADDRGSAVQPVLLAVRPVPNLHPSGLHDWNYANLLCLNAYTSKYRFDPGAIKAMRLYTRASSGKARLLGNADVEADGSFFVQVPADQPLQIELLDGSGKTLKRQQGWFWMRKGEQRICVGCHTGPERSPENAVPAVLLKSTIPVDLTGTTKPSQKGGR